MDGLTQGISRMKTDEDPAGRLSSEVRLSITEKMLHAGRGAEPDRVADKDTKTK